MPILRKKKEKAKAAATKMASQYNIGYNPDGSFSLYEKDLAESPKIYQEDLLEEGKSAVFRRKKRLTNKYFQMMAQQQNLEELRAKQIAEQEALKAAQDRNLTLEGNVNTLQADLDKKPKEIVKEVKTIVNVDKNSDLVKQQRDQIQAMQDAIKILSNQKSEDINIESEDDGIEDIGMNLTNPTDIDDDIDPGLKSVLDWGEQFKTDDLNATTSSTRALDNTADLNTDIYTNSNTAVLSSNPTVLDIYKAHNKNKYIQIPNNRYIDVEKTYEYINKRGLLKNEYKHISLDPKFLLLAKTPTIIKEKDITRFLTLEDANAHKFNTTKNTSLKKDAIFYIGDDLYTRNTKGTIIKLNDVFRTKNNSILIDWSKRSSVLTGYDYKPNFFSSRQHK